MRIALAVEELRRAHLLLEAVGAPAARESSGYRGASNSRTAMLARVFDVRARAALLAGDADRAATLNAAVRLLRYCSETDGGRCDRPYCPRCECRKAKRNRQRLEARLRQPDARFAHVSLGLASDSLSGGVAVLSRLVAALRRRVLWTRAVAGGEAHLHVALSSGCVRRWNVHVHILVQLRQGSHLDGRDVRALWAELLEQSHVPGSAFVRTFAAHWSPYNDQRHRNVVRLISREAFYVSARKPGRQLPALPPAELDEVLRFFPKQRRVSAFGCWRKPRRQPVVPPQSERKSA